MPAVDFAAHAALCAFVAGLVADQVGAVTGAGLVHAVHDVSGGGLAVALAEMAAAGATGCALAGIGPAELFTELPSRFVMRHGGSRRAVRPGRRRLRHPGRRARPGGRRPASASGTWSTSRSTPVGAAEDLNLARALGDR